MSLINFQSLTEIKNDKKLEREARQCILDKAKEDYERKERLEKEAKERGETTWMLPSVEDKVNPKKKKKKKHGKDKKRKKEKKEKKEKKKKRKRSESSSSSSSESDQEDNQNCAVWVEKPAKPPQKREEWMEISSLFKTQTRDQMRLSDGTSRALKKLEEKKRKEDEDKPGSHSRELNPYYKGGGSGLPLQESSSSLCKVKTSSYDASWLRRALQRAKDQAAEEGRTLEEVAKDRWGSLETFYKLLDEAEGKQNETKNIRTDSSENKSNQDYRSFSRNESNKYQKIAESADNNSRGKEKGSRNRSRSRERSRSRNKRSRSRERSRSRDKNRGSRSEDRKSRNKTGNERNNSDFGTENIKKKKKRHYSSSSSSSSGSDNSTRDRSTSRSSSKSKSVDKIKNKNSEGKKDFKSNKHSSSSNSSSSNSSSSRDIDDKKEANIHPEKKYKTNDGKESQDTSKKGKPMMRKPGSDDELFPSSHTTNNLLKPPEDDMNEFRSFQQSSKQSVRKNISASWRKRKSEPNFITSEEEGNTTSVRARKRSSSSSSSSTSSDESISQNRAEKNEEENPSNDAPILTDKEMNQLAAKLTKAELLGNTALTEKLKSKLDAARLARENRKPEISESSKIDENQTIILTRTDKTGFTRPVESTIPDNRKGKKNKKSEMFGPDGKRTSYFKDDFKSDLHSMFEKEKTISAEDQIASLENMSRFNTEKLTDDFDVDDMFIAKVAPKQSAEKDKEIERKRAIWEHQKTQKALDSCHFCVDNKIMKKHLIVSLGKKCYVSLPYHQSLTEGHCMIVPINHVLCATQADEDLWEEVINYQQALVRMFSANDEDCIFFESAIRLHQTPHMVIQCIPLPKETGELAPIYFKKAILECDEEWAQNKKLVDLKGRNVRKAVPKGLPYFYVDFGMTPGFAHVVENERIFPNNFAQEIIGGMIDADFSLFRKPKSENFVTQRKKVLKFAEMFKPFDPTENN